MKNNKFEHFNGFVLSGVYVICGFVTVFNSDKSHFCTPVSIVWKKTKEFIVDFKLLMYI